MIEYQIFKNVWQSINFVGGKTSLKLKITTLQELLLLLKTQEVIRSNFLQMHLVCTFIVWQNRFASITTTIYLFHFLLCTILPIPMEGMKKRSSWRTFLKKISKFITKTQNYLTLRIALLMTSLVAIFPQSLCYLLYVP